VFLAGIGLSVYVLPAQGIRSAHIIHDVFDMASLPHQLLLKRLKSNQKVICSNQFLIHIKNSLQCQSGER
jgi:hypothetical protein